ncbi:uncharacterized protein BDW70DRAFT_106384 [Aspergillus foveolatus]|uniref:uncharacterized protein n=1 Tax=Aspergillus foveolatus TaxID=210207 RepID=UPI003CCE4DAF
MCCIKETYAPVILRKRAAKRRKGSGDPKRWTRYDSQVDLSTRLTISLSRPFLMLLTEPICIFWDSYVALVYGALYLSFVAYPIAFQIERGWAPGLGGLSFVGIGIGVLIAIACEPLFRKIINRHRKDPLTGEPRGDGQYCRSRRHLPRGRPAVVRVDLHAGCPLDSAYSVYCLCTVGECVLAQSDGSFSPTLSGHQCIIKRSVGSKNACYLLNEVY